MSKDITKDQKNISVTVSKETWKKLKKLSVDKEISLPEVCKNILEKFASGRKGETQEIVEEI